MNLMTAIAAMAMYTQPGLLLNDHTASSGLDFTYRNGATGQLFFPEITGGGVGLIDYDRDGDLDLFLVQGLALNTTSKLVHEGNRLFRNDLDGDRMKFVDITQSAGIQHGGFGQGVAVGDANRDGWPDLYLTNFGPNQLWLNRGDGTFEDVSDRAGIADPGWGTSATWLDYDGDGWLDLFVCNYVDYALDAAPTCFAPNSARDYCGPDCCPASRDILYRNRGDGTFSNVSALLLGSQTAGAGLGVVAIAPNGIYVANDGDANELWQFQGGHFENTALFSGVALNRAGNAEASMGIAIGDYDNDGDEDLFLTHLDGETNTLYQNDGNALYVDRSAALGLAAPSRPYTGFGTYWLDLDNDGWLDLVVANGAVHSQSGVTQTNTHQVLRQPNQLFRNQLGKRFVDVSRQADEAFLQPHISRGLAVGDLDNDGDSDLVVSNINAPTQVFLSGGSRRGSWIGVEITHPNRSSNGTRVTLELANGETRVRWVRTDGSYASAHDHRVLFGLGSTQKVQSLTAHCRDGLTAKVVNPNPQKYHLLHLQSP